MANIGTISANIGLDADALSRDVRQAEQSLNHLGSSAKKVLDGIGTANERLTRQTSAYANELKSLVSDVERNQARLKVFQSDAGQTLLKEREALQKQIDKATPGFDRQEKQAEGLTTAMGGLGRSILAVAATYLTLRTAANFVTDSINAAAESEKVYDALSDSIERHGGAWKKLEGRVRAFTGALQQQLGVSDEVVAKGLQKLIDAGLTTAKSMDAMRLATDVAAGAHIELEQAIDLVAKSSVGITRGLTQIGIKLDETVEPAKKAEAAFKALNEKYSGAALDAMDTYSGRLKILKERFNELKEAIGDVVIGPLGKFIEQLTDTLALIKILNESNAAFWAALKATFNKQLEDFEGQKKAINDFNKALVGIKDGIRPTTEQLEKLYRVTKTTNFHDAIVAIKEYEIELGLTAKVIGDTTNKQKGLAAAIEATRQPLSEYVVGWKLVEDQLEEVKVKFLDLSNAQANLTAELFKDQQEYAHGWKVVADLFPDSEISKAFQIDYSPIADEVISDLKRVGDAYGVRLELVERGSKREADIEKGLRDEQIAGLEILLQSNRLTTAELEDVWSEYYALQLQNLADLQAGWKQSNPERMGQLTDDFTARLKAQKDEIDAWGKSWEKWFAQLDEDSKKLAESMSSAFEDNFFRAMEGEFNNLRDFIKSIVADITRSMEQELARLASQFLTRKIIGEPDIPEAASNAAELASIEALKSSYDSLSSSKSSLAQFVDITYAQSAANVTEFASVTTLTASYIALAAAKDAAASASGDAASGITADNLFAALPLAEGGLVRKPTFALIGEAGPEVVVPVSRMDDPSFWEGVGLGNRGKGGDNVIVNMTVVSPDLPAFKANQSQIMTELQVRLGQSFRRNR